MLTPVKISVVSYINTWPFLYGLMNHKEATEIFIPQLDYPSAGTRKIIHHEVPLGLLPVGGLLQTSDFQIVTNYCIGTDRQVDSVKIFTFKPIEQVKRIVLDYQSTTSVLLTKVLIINFWKLNVEFSSLTSDNQIKTLSSTDALLLIGDRCFDAANNYPHSYDLGEAWYQYTGLPFTFAVWAAHRDLNPAYVNILNQALQFGVQHLEEAIKYFNHPYRYSFDTINKYLTHNIKYDLTAERHKAVEHFLKLAKSNIEKP